MNVLTIQNLIKSFGSKKVLCGLELSVQEHSIFGFIGKKQSLVLQNVIVVQSMLWEKKCILDRLTPIGISAICLMFQNFIPI